MIIDSGKVGMESARSYRKASASIRRFAITDYRDEQAQGDNAPDAATDGSAQNLTAAEERKEGKTTGNTNTPQDWQARFQAAGAKVNIRSSASRMAEDFRLAAIRYIFELLFSGRKHRFGRWAEEQGFSSSARDVSLPAEGIPQSGGKVLSYTQETFLAEAEDTMFSTVGTVRTADGREISFNVNVGMSRRFQETFREDLKLAAFSMCDPLVINLDADAASLSDQTFFFDIDGDGEQDEVSQLGAGSGYLALDKNGDGVINDGRELFGTASGDGFADLAEYDEDGNGWIDENDAVWDKLQIWAKDENGKDVLYKLAEKGVGAICLQNVSTDFTLTGRGGRVNGAIRSSGIFLYENGSAGTVQHVDVAKYDKGA